MRTIRIAVLAALLVPACAIAADKNDLREFRVGMLVSALPQHGYTAFYCADDSTRKLPGWQEWKSCPAGPNGFHAVGFRYENAQGDGESGKTQVGGQPVTLALLIDDSATVAAIRIDTDPHSPLYLRKKAFLFARQVQERFGEDGWTCHREQPTATQQPIGGVFYNEHCEKTTPSRHFTLDRQLFHDPNKDLADFTGATQLTIQRPS